MKRKIIVSILICLLIIFGNQAFACANEVMPRYSVISGVDCTIYPGNGNIAFDIYVYVPNSTTLDSAYVDIVLRSTSGTVVGSFLGRKMTKEAGRFYYENSKTVTQSGTYFFTYEIRCYKDGELVDNPTGNSSRVTYNP